MPTFEYTAITADGARVRGKTLAATAQAAAAELEAGRLTPIAVTERAERGAGRGVSPAKLAASYGELSELLSAGVPLMRSLQLLGRSKSSPRLAAVYKELAAAISEGADVADAMAEHEAVFPRVHTAMVRAGERGGFLEGVFERLAELVAKQAELRGKVFASLAYPAFLVFAGGGILGALLVFFVPKFKPLITGRLAQLPFVTELVLGTSDLLTAHVWALLLGIAGVVAAIVIAWRQPAARRALTIAQTRMWIIGPIIRGLAVARFCRMLGTMEAGGVPLLQAMRIARDAAGNPLLEDAIDKASEAIGAGEPLAEELGRSGLFGEDVVEMIAVGEAAGHLDRVLLNVATTIEKRIDRLLTTAVRLIEPVLLLVIAAVIGIVAAGLILPMTQLSGTV